MIRLVKWRLRPYLPVTKRRRFALLSALLRTPIDLSLVSSGRISNCVKLANLTKVPWFYLPALLFVRSTLTLRPHLRRILMARGKRIRSYKRGRGGIRM